MSKTTMPTKKSAYEDDFDSEDMSELETLVSKPSNRKNTSASKIKKTPSKKPVPTKRAQSAPGTRSAREVWLASVKARNTGSPRNITMSGLSVKNKGNWGFLSTPNYMRHLGRADSGKKSTEQPAARQTAGTPAYKSQEEYYDDIIQLKKTIQSSNQEISNLRSKLRRTEEDNLKKEKEIEQLLDPTKSEELRRTLTDKKADAGAVIHSLKQKVLRLEVQLRDKEAANAKMLSELKMTKVDEMKTQMEVLYREIVRLQHIKDGATHEKPATVNKENNSKVKALNETVLRLNDQTQKLQRDNKKLKEDLQKAVDETASLDSLTQNQNLQNLGKNELVSLVRRLQRRLGKAEQKADVDSVSIMSADMRPADSSSKVVLEGTLENRLDQLDQRETELLQETDKLRAVIKRLKDDRTFYRQAADEKDIEIKVLKNSLEGLPPVSARTSARDRASAKDRKEITPRKTPARPVSARSDASRRRRDSASNDEEQRRAVDKFQKNHAAKNIQKRWREHQDQVRLDEATSTIQAAILSHHVRKSRLNDWRDDSSVAMSDVTVTDDEYNEAVDLIQSSLSGHTARRKHLNTRMESTTDEDSDIVRKKPPRHSMTPESRTSSRSHISGPQTTRRATVERDFYDDDGF